jgi:hypothetical protein
MQPINKTAALVLSSGVNYVSPKVIQNADRQTPIETRPLPKGVINLTGLVVGRLTVIGLSKESKGCWVVRCACGIFTLRRAKALKNARNHWDRCEECRHLAYLKRTEHWRRTGKNKPICDF